MSLVPVADAIARLLDGASALPAETVDLSRAAGRVLAADLKALRTQPPFDASAMDGYAVRAEDVATVPITLKIVGQAPAGHGFRGKVGKGETVRIFTGAPMPEGTDAVVIQENTADQSAGHVTIVETLAKHRNVRLQGLDFKIDNPILNAGRLLDPAALSLIAAANHPTVPVVRKPVVAILATGDELLPPGSAPGPDQIIASNSYGVAAVAQNNGATVMDLGIVPDREDRIAEAVRQAIEGGADVLVTLGGASVGDHDLVRGVLTKAGMQLGFWKIAMRPGKPLMFGTMGNLRVLGLPGNPVASLVCSNLFLAPMLASLGGRPHNLDRRQAVLGTPMSENDNRQDYVRAIAAFKNGQLVATPFTVQDSSMLQTLANANALIVREPFAPAAPEGSQCTVIMLRPPEMPNER